MFVLPFSGCYRVSCAARVQRMRDPDIDPDPQDLKRRIRQHPEPPSCSERSPED